MDYTREEKIRYLILSWTTQVWDLSAGLRTCESYNLWVTLPSRWGLSPVRAVFTSKSDPGGALADSNLCVLCIRVSMRIADL